MTLALSSYVSSVLQVTLVCGFALLLQRMLGRAPRTAAAIGVCTSCCVLALTVSAFLPLPSGWSLPLMSSDATSVAAPRQPGMVDAIPSTGTSLTDLPRQSWHLKWMWEAVQITGNSIDSPSRNGAGWPRMAILVIIVFVTCLIVRLLGGIWLVRRILGAAQPVTDRALLTEAARLSQSVGCHRSVSLYTSKSVPTAATVGCWHPVLILNSDWETWTKLEQTAVLVHELTHVRRLDYLTGLLARVTLAVHFYNPLVRWSTAHLFFAQEAVADDAAASAVGGRPQYLAILSNLALRQDDRLQSLPALAFAFTSSSFLMRRIRMLQAKDGPQRSSVAVNGVLVASLMAFTVAASALRQPAWSQEPGAVSAKGKGQPDKTAVSVEEDSHAERASFDMSHVAVTGNGVVAVRPKLLFARKELQTLAAIIDGAIQSKLRELGAEADGPFSVGHLEQAVGLIQLETNDPSGKHGAHGGKLMIGLSSVRADRPIPLASVLQSTAPGTVVRTTEAGKVIETPEAAIPALGPERHFAMPDSRTVLMGVDDQKLAELDGRAVADQASGKPWYSLWQQVEHNLVVALFDNTSLEWDFSKAEPEHRALTELGSSARHFALGYDLRGDQLAVEFGIDLKDDIDPASIERLLDDAIEALLAESANGGDEPATKSLNALNKSVLTALRSAQPQIQGSRVMLRTSVKLELGILVAQLLGPAAETARSDKTAQPQPR